MNKFIMHKNGNVTYNHIIIGRWGKDALRSIFFFDPASGEARIERSSQNDLRLYFKQRYNKK